MWRVRINPCYLNWWPGSRHSVFTHFLSVIPPIMNQLRSITSFKTLEQKLHGMEYDDFNNWLRELGFLHNPKHCESCGERMTQQRPKGKSREGVWRRMGLTLNFLGSISKIMYGDVDLVVKKQCLICGPKFLVCIIAIIDFFVSIFITLSWLFCYKLFCYISADCRYGLGAY